MECLPDAPLSGRTGQSAGRDALAPGGAPASVARSVRTWVRPLRAHPPRSFLSEPPENVIHWTVHDTGGHFPAIEEPELLVGDLRAFFRPLRSA